MATFEETRSMRSQQHFEVLEIDLPVITGTCTIAGQGGYGTPLTCDEAWSNEYKTYKFTNENCPVVLPGSPWRVIKTISETTAEIKPGQGLAARGSLTVTLNDFTGQDPNPTAPGVTADVKKAGSFFGKMDARYIFDNQKVRLKLYRVQPDGSVDLVNGAEVREYVASTFTSNGNGQWSLTCKDVLSLANLNEKVWPVPVTGVLRADIDESVTAIPVDGETDYSNAFAVRIGDETLKGISITGNLTPSATLNVDTRGSSIFAPVSGQRLTDTEASSHSEGDEVYICVLSDNERIDDLLFKVLVDSDFDTSYIPVAEWADEVDEWHASTRISTLHVESREVNAVLKSILTGFLMDMWFDVVSSKVKLSAISVWKESSKQLIEGKEINAYSAKKNAQPAIRASKALVLYDKKDLTLGDDVAAFNKGSQYQDDRLVSPALYSTHKDKSFEPNQFLSKDAADLLVQRYVSRFKFTPYIRSWVTDERNINFKTGDVVDIVSTVDQAPDGSNGNARGQITKINPKYGKAGRSYNVTAMTYEAAFSDNSEILVSSPLSETSLYVLAGAPADAVTITFVLNSYSYGATGFRAGAFPAGSKIILILIDGFDGQCKGGDGGAGESVYSDDLGVTWEQLSPPTSGTNGGVVYDAQGIDTDIYFSGATPSTAYPVADGYIRASGGGGNGGDAPEDVDDGYIGTGGDSGGGGAGRPVGLAGAVGVADGFGGTDGTSAANGDIIGNGGAAPDNGGDFEAEDGSGWGQDAISGLAGKGVVDSGATVTFYGANAARYINGRGDHP